jgi:hypothetical protein
MIVILIPKKLKPISVLDNTEKKFKALYEDKNGKYEFEVKKVKSGFIVKSCGFSLPLTYTKKSVLWEFETQLEASKGDIRCLS